MKTQSRERNLDFDTIVNRRGTNCLKYDFASERGVIAPGENPNDLIPLWIADMDFKTSSFIQDALQKQVEHGIFGYTDTKEDYFFALQNFYLKRHRFFIPSDQWVIKTPGVMFMLAMAVNAFTQKGDAVLIQEPVYMHFRDLIEASGRKVASNDLIYTQEGRYAIDFDDFERKIVSEKVKLFLLCNPHNPVCRVWSKSELETIGEICLKHRVIIVSDEIHNDFIFRGTHTMMASLSEEISNITISVTAPTKTFNLAGLQIAHTFIRNESLRRAIRREIDAVAYSQVPSTGITAAFAAYTKGETWLDALLEYIRGNIDYTSEFVRNHLPGIGMVPMEATYLAWLDFNGLGKSAREIDDIMLHRAKLWVNSGSRFGKNGAGFERLNLACPRATLETALQRIEAAFYG